MSTFTREEIDALYAPFPLNMHSIREGHKNSDKTKIQWFVYADRAAVQRRLDDLFPGEWEFKHIETRQTADYVSVTAELVIRGKARAFNGGQSPRRKDDEVDQDTEKGAFTEAFRRCASMWGVGLYLYEMDYAIWTDSYPDRDWKAKSSREADAKRMFTDWYNGKFGGQQEQRKVDKSTGEITEAPAETNPNPPTDEPDKRDMVATVVEIKTDRNKKPYLLYIAGDGTKASGRGRDTLKTAGYDTDAWKVEAGARYALHPPALVKISKSGQFWNVVEGSASKYDQALQPTGTAGKEIPF